MSIDRLACSILSLALAVAVALSAIGCGSGDSSRQTSAAGVTVTPPKDWKVQNRGDQGLVLALEERGLSSAVPQVPRFIARPAGGDLPPPRALVGAPPTDASGDGVIRPPARTEVDGQQGVAIQTRERRSGVAVVAKSITVALGAGRGYSFVAEAPAADWAPSRAALDQVLSSVKFDVGAVPRAAGSTR